MNMKLQKYNKFNGIIRGYVRKEMAVELIYYFTYFSTVVPSNSRPFVVNTTFSQYLQDLLKMSY